MTEHGLFPECVMDEPCPRCGAAPGEPCEGRARLTACGEGDYHPARLRLRELRYARGWVPRPGESVLVSLYDPAVVGGGAPALFVAWDEKGQAVVEGEFRVARTLRERTLGAPVVTTRRRETVESLELWRDRG